MTYPKNNNPHMRLVDYNSHVPYTRLLQWVFFWDTQDIGLKNYGKVKKKKCFKSINLKNILKKYFKKIYEKNKKVTNFFDNFLYF